MVEFSKIWLYQNSIFEILKIHELFFKSAKFLFVLFYNVYKENMFTIEIEDASTLGYLGFRIIHYYMQEQRLLN